MHSYKHILVLVQGLEDGRVLIHKASVLGVDLSAKVTVAHISEDYRELNYVSDSLMDDVVSKEIIDAKNMLSELVKYSINTVEIEQIITTRGIHDLEKCITHIAADLVVIGHRNNFLAHLYSHSSQYINHLPVDVLIHHIPA